MRRTRPTDRVFVQISLISPKDPASGGAHGVDVLPILTDEQHADNASSTPNAATVPTAADMES